MEQLVYTSTHHYDRPSLDAITAYVTRLIHDAALHIAFEFRPAISQPSRTCVTDPVDGMHASALDVVQRLSRAFNAAQVPLALHGSTAQLWHQHCR